MLQSTPPSPDRKAEPFYLDGPHGKLFAIYHPPQNNIQVKGCFLYIQPLAEEMNRCRQMVAIQAREFSKLGYGCLLLDLYGTGDSEGEYQDGNWDIYLADLNAGLRWISTQGYDHTRLWALRHGALLALDLARAVPALWGNVLLILSGNDWIAKEFKETADASPVWRSLLAEERLERHEIPDADHSFSKKSARSEMVRLNLEWLKSW
jgi:exosortase A-associated hydrolase 2